MDGAACSSLRVSRRGGGRGLGLRAFGLGFLCGGSRANWVRGGGREARAGGGCLMENTLAGVGLGGGGGGRGRGDGGGGRGRGGGEGG